MCRTIVDSVGTTWGTKAIWLRKSIPLKAAPNKPALPIYHGKDAEAWINGKSVAKLSGFITEYKVVPLAEGMRSAL